MRRPLVLSLVLAALLVASFAIAAKPTSGSATLNALGASGINGSADLRIEASGFARIHESIDGLTPGAQYTSFVYLNSTGCGPGVNVVPVQIMQFTANNAGKANFNASVPPASVPYDVAGGASISVQQSTTLLSCGQVIFQ